MPRHTNSSALRLLLSSVAVLGLVGLSVSLGASAASADPPYSISGTISDTTSAGIGSMDISLYDSSNNQVDEILTGSDGTYTFDGLAAGLYTVETTSPTGYVPIHSTVTIVDGDRMLDVTDPRIGTITGVVTAAGTPLGGVKVKAFDSVTGDEYDAASPTDVNGGYSLTLPATTGGYAFYFANAVGARLPIGSYDAGSGAVAAGDSCLLGSGSVSVADLAAGNPIGLAVALNPDPTVCSGATSAPAQPQKHQHAVVAQSLPAQNATPAPARAPTAIPTETLSSSTQSLAAPPALKPLLTPTVTTNAMPVWGWLLVLLAVVAMFCGVGFTVVRHR